MNVLGIIPARAGSVRLPHKNTRPLGGRPLVDWVLDAALAAKSLTRLVVSSDDPKVLELARRRDPRLALERPGHIATANSPAIEYVRHALEMTEQPDFHFDAVAIVQATAPFTLPSDIDATIALLRRTGADTAVTVVRVPHDTHPAKLKTLEGDRLIPYIEDEADRFAHPDLPDVYVRNCAVYVTRRPCIDAGQIIGEDCRAFEMPRERSVDINDGFDLTFAEFLAQRLGSDWRTHGR